MEIIQRVWIERATFNLQVVSIRWRNFRKKKGIDLGYDFNSNIAVILFKVY